MKGACAMKKIISMVLVFLFVISLAITPVNAMNEPHAAGIGFEVDASTVNNVGWYSEKAVDAYTTDEYSNRVRVGTVYIEGVQMTSTTKYLGQREDTWLTKITVEPAKNVSFAIRGSLWIITFKKIEALSFANHKVYEIDPMPTGLKMSAHMSTTFANQITETVKETWTVKLTGDVKYKSFKVGLGGGETWTTTTSKVLATPYDASRNNTEFNVSYTFLDPNSLMNAQQKSYCVTSCDIYSAKSLYGTDAAMANHAFKTSVTASFVSRYTGTALSECYEVKPEGSATVSAYISRAT